MELWSDRSKIFAGSTLKAKEADCFLLGIPFDSGCISIPGQRLAPQAIRWYLESFEPIKPKIYDIGDLIVAPEFPVLRERLNKTIPRIPGKFVCLGGDHSITLPIVEALKPKLVVSFDAHCDFRDEYLGGKLNAATVMKRVSEICEVIVIGVREKFGGNCVMFDELESFSPKDRKKAYLSIDVDVLDPSIMPGTGTPVPPGINLKKLFELIENFDPVAADIVEVNPLIEKNVSCSTAAKILMKLFETF
jgi:agmatinase